MRVSHSCLLQRAEGCVFACRGSLDYSLADKGGLFILVSFSLLQGSLHEPSLQSTL